MKKLKLNLDDLKVESFEISGINGQGTVLGQLPVESEGIGCVTVYGCGSASDFTCLTSFVTCAYTCDCTVPATCGNNYTCGCESAQIVNTCTCTDITGSIGCCIF